MSNTKKNAGCSNCKHYEYFQPITNLHGLDVCNSDLTVKIKGKVNDYKEGFVQKEYGYYPKRENKDLTCKGFTPIDWKAKYEAIKDKKPDPELYVKAKDYEESLYTIDKLDKKLNNTVTWLIWVSTIFFLTVVIMSGVYLKLG